MTETILFDNDGVLVDTERVFFESNREMMKKFGRDLDEAEFSRMSMSRGLSLADLIVSLGYTREEAEAARQERNLMYDRMLLERGGSLVIDGVREVLAELHGRFRIGVVTCCQKMHFRTIHEASGLAPYFDFVVGDWDFTHHKPHPEPYLKALERAGCSAAQAVAVEDSERGILSARAAGLRAYAIPRGLSLHGNFDSATGRFADIRDFCAFLNSFPASGEEIRNVVAV